MRRLLFFVLTAAALWSGYWYIGKSAKQTVLQSWFEDRQAAGWTAGYSDFRVVGFPSRFDSRFKDLELRAPQTGIGWNAPMFNILALSYKPNHIIAVFPHAQTLSFPLEDVQIDSSEMLASVVFVPDTKLAISRLRLHSTDVAIKGGSGWEAGAKQLTFSTRQSLDIPLSHDVAFIARNLTPTKTIRRNLDPQGNLPAMIDDFSLDLTLAFDRPWDRLALESGLPEVTKISVKQSNLGWGKLGLSATGELEVAANGLISGQLDLNLKNWREVLSLSVTSRLLDQATADTIANGLMLLTLGAVNPDNLEVPLTLQDGRMSLGPIPIGNGPRFQR